jgi:hypothetical protein
MRWVSINDGQMYPEASASGDQGDLLDTGWEVLWPGPARVYLSESDLRDIVVAEGVLSRPLVADALAANGWTAPGETAEEIARLEELLGQVTAQRAQAVEESDGLLASLARLAPADVHPELAAAAATD